MDATTKKRLYDSVIDRINNLSLYYDFTPQLVGSYAMCAYGLVDITDVHDLDIVIYTSEANVAKIEALFKTFRAETNDTVGYDDTKLTWGSACKRIPIKMFDTVNVCIFISKCDVMFDLYEKHKESFDNNIGSVRYNGMVVKHAKGIIDAKHMVARDKDKAQITSYMKKLFPSEYITSASTQKESKTKENKKSRFIYTLTK